MQEQQKPSAPEPEQSAASLFRWKPRQSVHRFRPIRRPTREAAGSGIPLPEADAADAPASPVPAPDGSAAPADNSTRRTSAASPAESASDLLPRTAPPSGLPEHAHLLKSAADRNSHPQSAPSERSADSGQTAAPVPPDCFRHSAGDSSRQSLPPSGLRRSPPAAARRPHSAPRPS